MVKGAIEGFINGFTTGALMFCASQAITALSNAASSRCKVPDHCFIAGTLILTSLGNKKIEDIEVGDEVWAYDEETGDKTLKKVVDLLRNKTKKWIHLLFEIEDGTTEKLVCTEGHPFYVEKLGWIKSCDLLENDSVLMYNNCKANVLKKEIEELEVEETTYNFEVSDYHTYYVGENSILVHNNCRRKAVRDAWKQEQKNALEGKKLSRDWNAKELQQLKRTGRVRGYEGHHINSVNGHEIMAGDPNNIMFVTRKEHLALHAGNWRNMTCGDLIIR